MFERELICRCGSGFSTEHALPRSSRFFLSEARPQFAPEPYLPSIFEWGVSIGLIAAAIFLFGLGARLWPVLPKNAAAAGPSTH